MTFSALTPARLGLVTVTYESGEVLRPFLSCVARQTVRDHMLVVVENDSHDSTRAILQEHADPRARLVFNAHNLGVAAANNQGIMLCLESGIEWIMLINNDTEFDPHLCEMLLTQAENNGCRVLVPAMTYFDEPDKLWYSGGEFIWYKGGIQTRHLHSPLPARPELRVVTYAPTCCMLIHRSVFDDVGLMDAAYFVYWDDTDFCWRLRRHGVVVHMYTGAVLAHKVSRLTGGPQSAFSIRFYSRNQVYFLRKHFPAAVVNVCVAAIRVKNKLRVLSRLDTVEEERARCAAIAEGLAMRIVPS